jgi:hypothetical protein
MSLARPNTGLERKSPVESGRLTSIVKHQVQLPWGGVAKSIFRGRAAGVFTLSKLLYVYRHRFRWFRLN